MTARTLQPCGTAAAWRRHKRNHEPVDAACERVGKKADADYRAERARLKKRSESPFKPVGDAFTLTLDGDDWRHIAASILDRSLTLRTNATTLNGGTAQADRLAALHKHIVTELRNAGAMP